jgi:hypothetical protein
MKSEGVKKGMVVYDRGSYHRVEDVRTFDKAVPTFCDGDFFDTKGPFAKVGGVYVYVGNLRPLTEREKGGSR